MTVASGGIGQEALRRLADGVLPDIVANYFRSGVTWSAHLRRSAATRESDITVTDCPGFGEAVEAVATFVREAHPGATLLHLLDGDPLAFTAAFDAAGVGKGFEAVAGAGGTAYVWPALAPARS